MTSRREFLKILSTSAVLPAFLNTKVVAAEKSTPPSASSNTPEVSLKTLALTRLSFGAREADKEYFQSLGKTPAEQFHRYVEEQLYPEKIDDAECNIRLATLQLSTLNKSLEQLWSDHELSVEDMKQMDKNNTNPSATPKKDENRIRLQPALETEMATWMRAVYSKRQLQELYVDFWHNHFNIFAYDGKVAATFVHYDRDVIRKHAFGNFREFLEAVAQSPSMLHYLDNALNQSGNPNENYARELFELHTLGAENYLGTMDRRQVPGFAKSAPAGYVDGDVYEAARCFTGWRVEEDRKGKNTGKFEYYEPWHDRFQKIVLGHPLKEYQAPMKDGHEVLDLLAYHPGTAHFIAGKICRRFVGDTPSPVLVARVAKVFHDNKKEKDQLRKTLRAVLEAPEFLQSFGQKVKRPFEFIAGVLRTSEANFTPTPQFLQNYEHTGQRLFAWRSPDGHPDTQDKWLSANSLLERWRLTNQILAGQFKEITVPKLQLNNGKTDFYRAIHEWENSVLPVALSEDTRNKLMTFHEVAQVNENQLRAGIALVYLTPEAQWR